MDHNTAVTTNASTSGTGVSNASAGALMQYSITTLALKDITVSDTPTQAQRRKHYDRAALRELATNIKTMGVIEPIIVRLLTKPRNGAHHELVAGERRWLASGLADLTTIPAIVRALTDAEVVEIQLVENLHREGLHPLEEAEGYEALMKEVGYGIDELIAKLGKSRAYIYARMKLLALGTKARAAFYEGTLNASTALLIARIPVAKLQDDALKEIASRFDGQPASFRDAQHLIQNRYMLRLKDAPFDAKDITLIPAAGACGACPKRTGNQPELFADIKSADVCTDPVCFTAKRAAWAARVETKATAAGTPVIRGKAAEQIAPYGGAQHLRGDYLALDEPCYSDAKHRTYRAIIGKTLGPVTLLQTREGNFIEIVKGSDYATTLKDKGVTRLSASGKSNEERTREKAARNETAYRERVFVAIRAKTPADLRNDDLRLATHALWQAVPHETRMRLVRLCDWMGQKKAVEVVPTVHKRIDTMSEADMRRLIIDCALAGELHANSWSTHKPERLLATAKRLGIEAEQIRKAHQAELDAKTQGKAGKGGKASKATTRPKATPESVAARAALKTPKRRAVKTAARKATKRAK